MARHPGKTVAQKRILNAIGCGDYSPPAKSETLAKMVSLGILERLPDKIIGFDALGPIAIPQHQMPIHIHMQWCDAVSTPEQD